MRAQAMENRFSLFLADDTRSYIFSLEECSCCGRVTPCRPILWRPGWECLDFKACYLATSMTNDCESVN